MAQNDSLEFIYCGSVAPTRIAFGKEEWLPPSHVTELILHRRRRQTSFSQTSKAESKPTLQTAGLPWSVPWRDQCCLMHGVSRRMGRWPLASVTLQPGVDSTDNTGFPSLSSLPPPGALSHWLNWVTEPGRDHSLLHSLILSVSIYLYVSGTVVSTAPAINRTGPLPSRSFQSSQGYPFKATPLLESLDLR